MTAATARSRGAALPEALEPATDDQSNTGGDVEVPKVDIRADLPFSAKEPAIFGEIAVHLLHEERVALRLAEHGLHQSRRRFLSGESLNHLGHAVFGETAQRHPSGQVAATQVLEGQGERVADVDLGVPICTDDEQGKFPETLGHMLEQQQRGLVRPLEVVEDKQHRPGPSRAGDDLPQAVEQQAPLQPGGKLERWRDVGA